jgi:hypothetical protein
VFSKGGLTAIGQITAKHLLYQRGRSFPGGDPVSLCGEIDFDESLGQLGESGGTEADLIAGMTFF